MLDSLRQRDVDEKPKDMPPALPSRPRSASRARLPSAKRPLPTSFEIGESETAQSSSNCNVKEDSEGLRRNSFVAKKVKENESPYLTAASDEKEHDLKLEEKDEPNLGNSSPGSLPQFRESDWDDNLGYFIKKVNELVQSCCLMVGIDWSFIYYV